MISHQSYHPSERSIRNSKKPLMPTKRNYFSIFRRLVYGSVHAFHSPAPEVGRKLNSATRSESPGRGTRKNKSAPSSTSSMNGLRASTGATSGSFNLNTCVGGGAGTGAGLSTSRSSGSGCGCSACGGQGSNHSHHGRNHSPLRGSTGRTTHPPWRSGMW